LAASRYGGKPALVCSDKNVTFCELNQLVLRFARALLTVGVRPGDRVTLYCHNCLEWIISYYAVARMGAVLNPINIMLTDEEVRYIASDCGAKAIIAPADKAAMLLDLKKETALESVIVYGASAPTGAVAFDELLEKSSVSANEHSPIKAESSDLASIMYTSGTTGHPKGVMLTHGNLTLNAQLTATMHVRTSKDITVSALPLCHVYGSVVLNSTMASGGTLVLLERFEEAVALDAIKKHPSNAVRRSADDVHANPKRARIGRM
jgi:long-chain acyl-CoA synthetase